VKHLGKQEMRNHTIFSLQKSFTLSEELDFSPINCINCFNLVIFAMVDDLHEKMGEYSRRENAERAMRSMEGTLKTCNGAPYRCLHKQIAASPGFSTLWLGAMRRMDTCMKADLGVFGETKLQQAVPDLSRKMITKMKEKEILLQKKVR
jgi:brefeldin A-resistance guanine nucleotide exchange factor 1